DGLLGWLAERLPGAMIPSTVVVLGALPLTANGKVDRAALPEPHAAAQTAGRAPATDMERAVAATFAEVLRCPAPSAVDDFSALGGHSLLAAQVVSRLRRSLGVPVALPALFAHPTVAGLAGQLALVQATPGRTVAADGPAVSDATTLDPAAAGPTAPVLDGEVAASDAIPAAPAGAAPALSAAPRPPWFPPHAQPRKPGHHPPPPPPLPPPP